LKINYLIYVVTDNEGNKNAGVVNDNNDTVHLSGLKNRDGIAAGFEAKFYHLEYFCWIHGMEFRTISMDADI